MRKYNCLIRLSCYFGYYIPVDITKVEWVQVVRSAAWTAFIWIHFVKFCLLSLTNIDRLQILEAVSGFVYSLSGALVFTVVNLNYKACWKLVNKLSALHSESMLTTKQETIIGRICNGLIAFQVVSFVVGLIGIVLFYEGGLMDEFYVKNQVLPFKYESLPSESKAMVFILMTILSSSAVLQYHGTSRIAMYATANILYVFGNLNEEMEREVQKRNASTGTRAVAWKKLKNSVLVLNRPLEANHSIDREMQDVKTANNEQAEIANRAKGENENDPNESTLGTLKHKHEELCNVVDLLNSFLSIPVGITLFSTIVSSCINLYMMANASGILGITNASFFLFTSLLQSGTFLTCGLLIHNKVST